jgi:hypothetical protein
MNLLKNLILAPFFEKATIKPVGVSGLLGSSQRPIAQIPLSRPNSNSKCQNSNAK